MSMPKHTNRQSETKETKQSEIVAFLVNSSNSDNEDDEAELLFRNLKPSDKLTSQVQTIIGELETDEQENSYMQAIHEIQDSEVYLMNKD